MILLFLFFCNWLPVYAQENKVLPGDSTVVFKVFGACIQCKERIEKAVKGRGVRSADWNIGTKQLLLVYNPSQTSLDKIRKRIVAAGHDLDDQKAKADVYKNLPACCHYRELDKMNEKPAIDSLVNVPLIPVKDSAAIRRKENANQFVKGVVLETNRKGGFDPLVGATVTWLKSGTGVTTDSNGVFGLRYKDAGDALVVSYTGYKADTLIIDDLEELRIILGVNKNLKEVTVTSKLRSTYLAALNPIRTQVMTEKELFKAACCNLSESFETNPSVDVSYNDAVTGSKQIQLLGLSGIYTQLTVENLPGPRGIATPLGLNSVPGPWVESIQLTKGIGSVANGYESIAGQINVELKKPENSERLYANVYINDFGKTDLNLNLAKRTGKKWAVGLMLHDDFLANRNLDFNKDGFRDLPTGNQFNLFNRWKYDDGKGFLAQFGIKLLNDKRTGGELGYDPERDKNTTNKYGLGINTQRYELFAKTGYVFPEKKYKSIGLQLSSILHRQDAYFGFTGYKGKQQNFYANLIFQSIINTTVHKYRTGLSFLHDRYNEDFNTLNFRRTENVPGVFFEYTYTPSEHLSLIAGLRADHNSLYGFFATPRLHIRYEPIKGTTIRLSAGRGQRTANIFAENTGIFASSRQLKILTHESGKAYGLNAETAWNKGLSIDQKFKWFGREGLFSIDFFRNDFKNQVIADVEDPREIRFYNLQGRSYSNSLQAELNVELLPKFDLRLAYRYFDVKSTYNGALLKRPLVSVNRAFANLAYATHGWKFDCTINYSGGKRIPGTQSNPQVYQRKLYSPGFTVMNTQISKTVGKKHPMEFYLGAENLGDYFQKDLIISSAQPFSPYFDASMVWGPVTGRMFYTGWRYKIK